MFVFYAEKDAISVPFTVNVIINNNKSTLLKAKDETKTHRQRETEQK